MHRYISTFRVLAMVTCQYVKPSQLWPLVYPLCQMGCGVIDLLPSPKCFPLHLNLVGILNRISKALCPPPSCTVSVPLLSLRLQPLL